MDMIHLNAIEYRDKKFPESRYEDGDINIEQLYDGITEAYVAGYNKCQQEEKQSIVYILRRETGCGLMEANAAISKLIEALKHKPLLVMDKPYHMKITWEE